MTQIADLPTRLDLADTGNALVEIASALVVPPPRGNRMRGLPSGIFDAEGRFVPQSLSWTTPEQPVNSVPALPEGEIPLLAGRYLFGGILYGHFGHFIVESLARLWALDAVEGPIDGMVFTPKVPDFAEKSVQKLQRLAATLGLRVPIIVASDPLRVERLFVPQQGFGMNTLIEGSSAFRDFINRHAGAEIPAEGAERLYISRSKLPPMRGSILGEARLEQHLAAEGYDIFHPQSASPEEQIARYKAAKLIVSTDCSPLHLVGYVGSADQRVAILGRRSMEISDYLARQLRQFKGMEAEVIDCLVNDWMPQPGRRPSRTSFGEADFAALHGRLRAAGFISDSTPWVSLNDEERAAELARLQETHQTEFLPFRDVS